MREHRDGEVRDDERRQQHEQGERQELLVDVPEEEEQVGEEDGGGQAANVQEVHAKQRERGEGIEPPTGLPEQREDRVEDRELRAKRGDVGELGGKEAVRRTAEHGARSAAAPGQRQTDRSHPR